MLYSFKGGPGDGEYPTQAALLDVNGTLYGTTKRGGTKNRGTVFSITTSGAETVLHSFGGSGDGVFPYGGLLDVNGTLYGTTSNGGSGSCVCDTATSLDAERFSRPQPPVRKPCSTASTA